MPICDPKEAGQQLFTDSRGETRNSLRLLMWKRLPDGDSSRSGASAIEAQIMRANSSKEALGACFPCHMALEN